MSRPKDVDFPAFHVIPEYFCFHVIAWVREEVERRRRGEAMRRGADWASAMSVHNYMIGNLGRGRWWREVWLGLECATLVIEYSFDDE